MQPGSSRRGADSDAQMLREAARRFLAGNWPPERAVSYSGNPVELGRVWAAMAGQGWLSLGAQEGDGGMRFAAILLEELGRAGCPAPLLDAFLGNVVLGRMAGAREEIRRLIERLHDGKAALSCAPEGDANAGALDVRGGGEGARVYGRAAFVEGTSIATHILVIAGGPQEVAVVAATGPGVAIAPTPGLSVPPLAEIEFDGAPAITAASDMAVPRLVQALARLGLAARALGAARRGFELVTDYAKVRTQFGKKIGQYQAIQHKLANCFIDIEASRLAIERAASSFDHGDPDWVYAAGCAAATAGPALRRVCFETHHAFGGVSFWEEHEMPRHFRRIHADLSRCGGVHRARADIARYLLGEAG